MTSVVTIPKPYPTDLNYEQRQEILAWLESMGVSREKVYAVELLTIDAPLVRVSRYATDPDTGRVMLDRAEPADVIRHETDHLLTVDPPAWWQPTIAS